METPTTVEETLRTLSPLQRDAVVRLIEDRFVNAISPLGLRLSLMRRREDCPNPCALYDCADRAVEHIMEHVNDFRATR